jgi:peptide/nickel transport system permease protein
MSSISSLKLKLLLSSFRRSHFAQAVRANPFSLLGILLVLALIIVAVFPQLFTNQSPTKINVSNRLLSPSVEHRFGTSPMGVDLLSQVIYGTRVTLEIVIIVLTIAVSIGVILGSIAGYVGGIVDDVIMRVTDIFLAFPNLILALAINTVLGRGLPQTVIAVAASWWPSYARLIRGQILSVKNNDYVIAARSIGSRPFKILTQHIFLNAMDPVIVRVTLDMGWVALTTAGLSFLGIGAQPPTPEWGRLVAEGREYILDQWWLVTFPGIALFMEVVGFNLLGILIRDWLDPSSINR